MLTITPNLKTKSNQQTLKNQQKVSFKGLNFEISHLIRSKSYTEDGDIFINNENKKSVIAKKEAHIIGDSKIDKIKARVVELFDNSNSKLINAKYISLFDNSTAKSVIAETSVSTFTDNKVGKIFCGGNVNAQNDKGGYINEIIAKHSILLGQKQFAGTATAPLVHVINNAAVKIVITDSAEVASDAKVNKIISGDSVKVRGNAKVSNISAGYHLGLSGECTVGKVKLTGNNAEVHMMDTPKFGSIEFEKGNGKVILHPDYKGEFTKVNEAKIKGGTIERAGGRAINPANNAYSDVNLMVEYLYNF